MRGLEKIDIDAIIKVAASHHMRGLERSQIFWIY